MATTLTTRLDRHIVIIGMMGSGKTRIGRALADCLSLPFIDCDTEIETAAGCSISDYFAQYGETAFRDGEYKVIDRLVHEPVFSVISSGGGAVTHPATQTLFQNETYTIWLSADIDTLVERTSGSDRRPLLNTGNPKDILTDLLNKREHMYRQSAHFIVDANSNTIDDTVDSIITALHTRLTN